MRIRPFHFIHNFRSYLTEHSWITNLFQEKLHLQVLSIEKISEGWTNRSYKIQTTQGSFFFRSGTAHPEVLGISRENEALAYDLVRNDEITPNPVYIDLDHGILITPFIEGASSYGKVLGNWTGNREEVLSRVAQLMRTIHSKTPPEPKPTTYAFDIIKKYFAECTNARARLPEKIEEALAIADKVQSEPMRKDPAVLCHHDFFWENLLYAHDHLFIVDWEYSDWDDPFYDLAGFCIAHRLLEPEERNLLLKAYFTTFGEEEQKKLTTMCMLYSLKNALWGFLQETLRPDLPSFLHTIADMHYKTFWQLHAEIKGMPILLPTK